MEFKFDVVVSGISGRFPQCDDTNAFKKKLYNSVDLVASNAKDWPDGFKLRRLTDTQSVPNVIGKYTNEMNFDFQLFKFNRFIAKNADINHRKVLEPAFEAIVDAGVNPYSLDGAKVGVYMMAGLTEMDSNYDLSLQGNGFVIGSAKTMGPNRVSYALNLTGLPNINKLFRRSFSIRAVPNDGGPSQTIVVDPLGSLEGLKIALQQITDGTIEAAIVMAASHLHHPTISYLYRSMGLLTLEEFSRCFDENASGYVRSECTVALFLQRAEDAKRSYGKVLLCDTLYEGLRSHSLLDYDENYLKNALREIYRRNDDETLAGKVSFAELTGWALKRPEAFEVNAIADILSEGRENSLLIGSVKSVAGHTESSSGLLAVVKALFALDSKIIAPTLHFANPNSEIRSLRDKTVEVVHKQTKLPGSIVAANIVGLFGAVNHIVLQANSKESNDNLQSGENLPRLLLLSGRTTDGLKKVLKNVEFGDFSDESTALANEVFQKDMPFHFYRGFTILPKTQDVTSMVEECADKSRPICYVFSGMGSQWNGMGKQLLSLPVFADVIRRCDVVLKTKSIDLYEILLSDDPHLFDDITLAFVGISSMQIALVEVLKRLNIEPDIILGHSLGENGCGYADGCLTVEQAVLAAYSRGIAATSTKCIEGMMAAIGKGYKDIKPLLPENVQVACHNSSESCTLTGPAKDVENFVEQLKKKGIFARSVNVSNIAYHSKYILPAESQLRKLLQEIIPKPKKRSAKWLSTSVPESEWDQPFAQYCSAEYLTNNMMKPVLFEECLKYVPKNAILIEIAPHGLMQAILRRAFPATCTNISLTLRSAEKDNLYYLLSAVGKLFIAGCQPVVNNLYPPVQYPVSRGTPSLSSYCTWYHGNCDMIKPTQRLVRSVPLSSESILVRINEDSEYNYLKFHKIYDQPFIPTSFFLYLAWSMLSIQKNIEMNAYPILFENVKVYKHLKISITKPRIFRVLIQGSGCFEVLTHNKTDKDNAKVILTGRIEFILDHVEIATKNLVSSEFNFTLNQDDANAMLKKVGFHLGKCFQLMSALKMEKLETRGKVIWNGNWITFLDSTLKFQMVREFRRSKLCNVRSVRKILIIPRRIDTLPTGSEIVCYHNEPTKIFRCDGIEMHDIRCQIHPQSSTANSDSRLKINPMKFISYANPSCMEPNEFFELCLRIAVEYIESTTENHLKLNIYDFTGEFRKHLRNIGRIDGSLKSRILYRGHHKTTASWKISHEETNFVITNDSSIVIDKRDTNNLFILRISTDSKNTPPNQMNRGFVTLITQSFSGKTYCLLKKEWNCEINHDISGKTYSKIFSSTRRSDVILRPSLDLNNLTLMFSKDKPTNKRYLFVLDKHESSYNYEQLKVQKMSDSFPVSVLRNDDLGSYKYLALADIEGRRDSALHRLAVRNNEIESLRTDFICTEIVEQRSNGDPVSSQTMVGLEFSGVNAAGERLMGLTAVNSAKRGSKMDPLLTWSVPEEWTQAEAATVPFIHAHVYRILNIIERSSFMLTPKVLINAGKDNFAAVETCISLCLVKKFIVYVAVPNDYLAKKIKQNCPSLDESNIIIDPDLRFDLEILRRTKGEGVTVVVNYLAGRKMLKASFNCFSYFSCYIETVESNMNENYEIGMFPFQKSLHFVSSPCNILHLVNLRDDDKKIICEAVAEGIRTGFVGPRRQLMNTTRLICMGNNENEDTDVNPRQINNRNFKITSNGSCIIIAAERRNEETMEIINWLYDKKNVSKFVVILENLTCGSKISRQLNQFVDNKKAVVSVKPLSALHSLSDDAIRIINHANKMAPLDTVFFVGSLNEAENVIGLVDKASQNFGENIKLVSLFSGGLDVLERRCTRGSPAFVFHGETFPKQMSEILEYLDEILIEYELKSNRAVLYHVLEETQPDGIVDNLTELKDYLPDGIENLELIGRSLTDDIKFVEMTSKGPSFLDCRETHPIFVVPSVHGLELRTFFNRIMYPVFCASWSTQPVTVDETVAKLFDHLNEIQPQGPVTLVGETWNASVAIELSIRVKKSGRQYKLFLLEGDPFQWKQIIDDFGLADARQFENVIEQLYCETVKSTENREKLKGLGLNDDPAAIERTGVDFTHVHRCLNMLKQRFKMLSEHTPSDGILENILLFSKRPPKLVSLRLSITSNIIVLPVKKYRHFIRNTRLIKKINKETMFAR